MINIPMKSKGASDKHSIHNINRSIPCTGNVNISSVRGISSLQSGYTSSDTSGHTISHTTSAAVNHVIPVLSKRVMKGQKVSVDSNGTLKNIKACFGWNTKDSRCDVDVSAFLLGENKKVSGDSWFVFYGQTESPDSSVKLHVNADGSPDIQTISIDFTKLNPQVKRIVFVLTINEAFDKGLNFGMMNDAYVRILDNSTGNELVSFMMTDYYTNVISMMIGEIYCHNNTWKFNAIGNGVAKDLEGLCDFYGVETT